MARPSFKDPLEKFRWSVSIDGFTRLGFTSIEVPSFTIRTQSYSEGGNHLFPKQIIDSIEYKPVTLMRGVTSDKSFIEWAHGFTDILINRTKEGSTNPDGTAEKIPAGEYRRTVTIEHLDRQGRPIKVYILHNAFPIEFTPASDFSSDADDGYSMEKLVLTYESFEIKTIDDGAGSQFNVNNIFKRLIRRSF